MNYLPTYTVKQDQTHGEILVKNGSECICPFQPAIPTQSNLGGIAIMRIPCSTSCPHAVHYVYKTTAGTQDEFAITCTGSEQLFAIESQPETKLKLV